MEPNAHLYEAVALSRTLGKLQVYQRRALAFAIADEVRSNGLPELPASPANWPEPMVRAAAELGRDAQEAHEDALAEVIKNGVSQVVTFWAGHCHGLQSNFERESTVIVFPSPPQREG
jgi:hypothetical protein